MESFGHSALESASGDNVRGELSHSPRYQIRGSTPITVVSVATPSARSSMADDSVPYPSYLSADPQVNYLDNDVKTSLNVLSTPRSFHSIPLPSCSKNFLNICRDVAECDEMNAVSYGVGLHGAPRTKQGTGPGIAEGTVAAPPVKMECISKINNLGQAVICNPSEQLLMTEDSLLEEELLLKEEELRCRRSRLELYKKRRGLSSSEGIGGSYVRSDQQGVYAGACSSQNAPLYHERSLEECMRNLVIGVGLPKIELEPFDGSPLKFHNFIRNFELNVASRLNDSGQMLSYLIYYCKGRAKEAIEHCVLLPKEVGYSQATEILKQRFGRPHEIIQAVTKDLFNGPRISQGDLDGLQRLATQMKGCQLTLSQLSHPSEMNCSTNLLRIVDRLPRSMQEKWAEVADTIINLGREPSFDDLLGFVEKRISVSSNLYGQLIARPNLGTFNRNEAVRFREDAQRTSRSSRVSTVVGTVTEPSNCPVCNDVHELQACQKFAGMSLDERRAVLKDNKRCFVCLLPNHMARYCRVRVRCLQPSCGRRHHTLMHTEPDGINLGKNPAEYNCVATSTDDRRVRLGFVPVRLVGRVESIDTYAFLDNGSDTTLIDESIAKRLGLPMRVRKLNIRTLHGSETTNSYEISLMIQSLEDGCTVDIDKAFTVKSLPVERAGGISETDVQRWPHLSGIPFISLAQDKVGILIGCDVPEAHLVTDQRAGQKGQPYAVKSLLGWSLRGPTSLSTNSKAEINFIKGAELHRLIQDMFEAEFFDGGLSDEKSYSVDDRRAVQIVESSATLIEGKYEISLPWRSECIELPDNRWMAQRRLMLLRKRLLRDSDLRKKYSDILMTHLQKGYVEKVDPSEDKATRRWYLPHHPVLNPNKPGKVRIVFDCAANYKNSSLNKALLQGPVVTNNLIGVLLRFRKGLIALSADIEEMFLQVKVPEKDRWALSFLWWDNESMTGPPDTYEITVHPFGATSSPFCASFALRKTAIDNGHLFNSSTGVIIRENFYVDDCLVSVDNLEDAKRITSELRSMLRLGGFRLVKWLSNVPEALSDVPQDEKASIPMAMNLSDRNHQRALGIQWHLSEDSFKFRVILPQRPFTRRGLLACVASVYDPLGFIAPIVLRGRKLLQQLCSSGVGWDTPLEDCYRVEWERWSYGIGMADTVVVPRCIRPHGQVPVRSELHMFSDASEMGYGAVGYLREVLADGSNFCCFLIGKARVAPLKPVSIPRLELTAAVLAAKLMRFLLNELRISFDLVTLWTDSTIVLEYINNTSCRFVTFVANRVQVIREYTEGCQWRHVPSELNPADVASRGTCDACSTGMNIWLKGPQFLWSSDKAWPPATLPNGAFDHELEVKKVLVSTTFGCAPWYERLFSRYAQWYDLLRAVSWLIRFKAYFICMKTVRQGTSVMVGPLRKSELDLACESIIRMEQQTAFGTEFSKLHKHQRGALGKLKPISQGGVLYLGGRVQGGSHNSAKLMILPSRGVITDMVIRHYHETHGHMGASYVLASIRRKFWIVKGMASVRRVLTGCMKCKMLSARPCQQVMAPLPEDRTTAGAAPFTACGVDYFGPLEVRIGRSTCKRYGCLFTCLRTRAIHLEVAQSLSTDSFLMALVRFVGRRGVPEVIYSDNGSNFVGAESELKRKLVNFNQEKIHNTMMVRGIDWHFNPPAASHWGGIWERMIRTVRRVMQAVIRQQVMSDEALHTYLIEVERIVNDRPLVPVYDDPDGPSVLRPSDLLLLKPNNGLPCTQVTLVERYTKGWRQAQHLASVFWKRWISEYLPTIQARHKWTTPERDINVGDLVLLLGGSRPVGVWPKAVVSRVVKGKDNHVREVYLKTSNGLIRRDVRSICLLEGCGDSRVDQVENAG